MNTALVQHYDDLLRAIGSGAAGHAVFFRHGTALLLLPRDRQIAALAAALYRPQSCFAKAAAAALRSLCRAGLHFSVLPTIPGETDGTGALLCNAVHGVRLVAVRRTPGLMFEVVKAALENDAAPIRAEYHILSIFQGRPGVPATGPLSTGNGAVWFTMQFLERPSQSFDPFTVVESWQTQEMQPAVENGLIRELLPLLEPHVRDSIAGATVRRALVHGDFAPWNWREDASGLPVFIDWEWARDDGFAGFDLVYAALQTAILVHKTPHYRLVSAVRAFIHERSGETGRRIIENSGLTLDALVALVSAYRKQRKMT